jgi:phage protein D
MPEAAVTHTPNTKRLMSQVYVTVDGTELEADIMADLLHVRVEDSMQLPDMAILTIKDEDFKWSNVEKIKLGQELKIKFGEADNKSDDPAFVGDVVALESELQMEGETYWFVRAYDRSHKLHRGRITKTYLNVKDSDIATQVAQSVGLTADVETTNGVHDWVVQDNQTNWEFLQERAAVHGFLVVVEDRKLLFKSAPSFEKAEVSLTWSQELLAFRATKTTCDQVTKVQVRGWDPINKQEVSGEAQTPSRLPELEQGEKNGGNAAKAAFHKDAAMITARQPIYSQAEANTLAQTILDEMAGGFVTARGTALGNPELKLGSKVDIKSAGKFTGKYLITEITHRFDPEAWYIDFEVTGGRSFDLLTLVRGR